MKRKEIENETRKNNIIEAAEKLFLKKGYYLTTMDDIAQKSEFSKPTIYKYFLSKEDIGKHIHLKFLSGRIEHFLKIIESKNTPYDKLYYFAIAYYDYAETHIDEFKFQLIWDSFPAAEMNVSDQVYNGIKEYNEQIGSVIKNEMKKLMPCEKPYDEFNLHHTMVSFYASLRVMISHAVFCCSRENVSDGKQFYINFLKLFLRGLEKN